MIGCLTAPFKLLFVVLLVLALVAAWLYRDRLRDWGDELYRRVTNQPAVVVELGRPSAEALARAEDKVRGLSSRDSVVLDADEVASLMQAGFEPYARGTLDSMTVRLGDGTVTVAALVRTARIPSGVLGPFGSALREREPITAAGTLAMAGPGSAAWTVDRIAFRDIPLPRDAVPMLLERIAGDSTRALPVRMPRGVTDLRVTPGALTLFPARP